MKTRKKEKVLYIFLRFHFLPISGREGGNVLTVSSCWPRPRLLLLLLDDVGSKEEEEEKSLFFEDEGKKKKSPPFIFRLRISILTFCEETCEFVTDSEWTSDSLVTTYIPAYS